jgi:hypothetical protein
MIFNPVNPGHTELEQSLWEKAITRMMIDGGWVKDRDDAIALGFHFEEGNHNWIRDYDKKSRRFVQFDGNQEITIVQENKYAREKDD